MEKWTLKKRVTFEASHILPQHDGKCARLHGHSWTAEIEVAGHLLIADGPMAGMVADFGVIGAPLKRLVAEKLDHYHLNESTGLANPTSEALAKWIYQQLVSDVAGLCAVVVNETCTSSCRYEPARP